MFIILLFKILSAFAQEGYPKPSVDVEAVVKNKFCFPIVVTINDKIIQVSANQEHVLPETKWSKWHWLPGTLGQMSDLSVGHPLKSNADISYGPFIGSHKNKYAYDFSIPEGTEVLSMADGVVARIIQHYYKAHNDPSKDEGNYIEVVHDDGSVAQYYHLKKNSSRVALCQKIKKGDVIAESGNTGYSDGPHLHVEVYRPTDGKNLKTLPLVFK